MNTKETINSIPEVNRKHLELYSDLIAQFTKMGNAEVTIEYSKKMRGYLDCMKDNGTITEVGVRVLYMFYRSTRVGSIMLDS